MRELLKRWAQLQPSRCNMRTETLGPALVTLGGYGHYYWGEPASAAVVLAATIEAITARSWMWSLGTVTSRPSIWGFVNPDGTRSHEGAAATPAEALLAAYLSALEAA